LLLPPYDDETKVLSLAGLAAVVGQSQALMSSFQTRYFEHGWTTGVSNTH